MKFFQKDPYEPVRDLGRKDGAYDQNHADDHARMVHGNEPIFDPSRSLEHSLWQQQSSTTKLDVWTECLEGVEDELIEHQPRWLLLVLLAIVLLIEFETAVLFWRDQGVGGITRVAMAAGTSGASVFLPWFVVDLAKQWRSQ